MSDSAPKMPGRVEQSRRVSVTLGAIFVPVIVVMVQAVYAANGNGFRNAFLGGMFHPIILILIMAIALISFFALRPFTLRKTARRIMFLLCVILFTILALFLTPALVE